MVQRAHPEANLTLSYINALGGTTEGGDQYTGLDRFGRVIDQYWSVGATATDNYQYTYHRDSNPLTRTNVLRTALSEQFGYDALNRVSSFTLGSHSQSWGLDAQGNWLTYTMDSTTQTRTHNGQNQITTLTQPGLGNPAYDANGNTTQDEFGDQFKYDAWNRLVHVTAAGNSYTYSYDALGRRITSQVNTGSATDLYYSSAWQVVEEQVGGAMTAQYVWSPVYLDAMIERDSATFARLYVQQDAGWDVTAVVYTSGAVQERYAYNPYGKAGFLEPGTWQVHGGGTYGQSSVGWVYLHQGGRYEWYSDAAGMYLFRNRDYSPTFGRWLQEDPAGYAGTGTNLYQALESDPARYVDPAGLGILDTLYQGAASVGNTLYQGAAIVTDVAALNGKALLSTVGVQYDYKPYSDLFNSFTPQDVERAAGTLQAVGAAGEAAVGVALSPVPVLGPVALAVFGLHAADDFGTGMSRALSGEPAQTYTSQVFGPEVDQALNGAAAGLGLFLGLTELAEAAVQRRGGGLAWKQRCPPKAPQQGGSRTLQALQANAAEQEAAALRLAEREAVNQAASAKEIWAERLERLSRERTELRNLSNQIEQSGPVSGDLAKALDNIKSQIQDLSKEIHEASVMLRRAK